MTSCRKCSTPKEPSAFRAGRKDCRSCERSACRSYGSENRPRRNARLSRWRRENPEKASAVDRRKRLREYGLTEQDREAMATTQQGLCRLCAGAKPLVVDHCHTTGRVRGLLCKPCNNFVGWIENNAGIIDRAGRYLDQPCHADVLLEIANS